MNENFPPIINLNTGTTHAWQPTEEPPAHDPKPEEPPVPPTSGFALDHKGIDWEQHSPGGGIYLWMRDASAEDVGRGGGVHSPASLRMLKGKKIRGWDTGKVIPGNVRTTAEAMQIAGLDWTVTQYPVYAHLVAQALAVLPVLVRQVVVVVHVDAALARERVAHSGVPAHDAHEQVGALLARLACGLLGHDQSSLSHHIMMGVALRGGLYSNLIAHSRAMSLACSLVSAQMRFCTPLAQVHVYERLPRPFSALLICVSVIRLM
jgi:hypothetical protein